VSRESGAVAEERAARYLVGRGCRILEKNFLAKTGEIDLIVVDGDTLVFVEVKARSSSSFGLPQEFVFRSKIRKIVQTAKLYLLYRRWDGPVRFDVVAFDGVKTDYIPAAFDAGGR
jgi:putative endonuclease